MYLHYMCKNSNKKIKKINICEETNLPPDGWIQGCIWCKIPTSKTTYYKTYETKDVIYTLNLHLCKDCINYKILDSSKNIKIINNYIDKYYLISCGSNSTSTSL